MASETFGDLTNGACPECDTMLLTVHAPLDQEIEDAAAAGDEEGKRLFAQLSLSRERRRRSREDRLTSVAQLPDLRGEALAFRFDREESEVGGEWVVSLVNWSGGGLMDLLGALRADRPGPREIWREVAFFEDWRRFFAIKALLQEKYGERFRELCPTTGAAVYLLGEDPRAPALDPS